MPSWQVRDGNPHQQLAEVRRLYGRHVGERDAELRMIVMARTEAGAIVLNGNGRVGSWPLTQRTFADPAAARAYLEQSDRDRQAEGFRLMATNIAGRDRPS